MKNDQAFLNWAHNITAEVQRLLTAKRDTSSADKLGSDMREMRDALETQVFKCGQQQREADAAIANAQTAIAKAEGK